MKTDAPINNYQRFEKQSQFKNKCYFNEVRQRETASHSAAGIVPPPNGKQRCYSLFIINGYEGENSVSHQLTKIYNLQNETE